MSGRRLQGTVRSFEASDGSGDVLLDDGTAVPFDGAAFAAGGLQMLRPGQRVRMTCDDDGRVVLVTILTLADPMT